MTDRGCALVTGASRGIGAAIAGQLAEDGWAVGARRRDTRGGRGVRRVPRLGASHYITGSVITVDGGLSA